MESSMSGQLVRSRLLVTRWGAEHVPLQGGALFVEDGRVAEIGSLEELRRHHPAAEQIGDGSHLVIPGFVNSHSHGRGITTLRQGIPDDPGEVRSVGLRIGLSGDPYWDVLYTCARQLEAGITGTMHLDTNYGYGPLEAYEKRLHSLITAYGDSGIRFSVALPFRDSSIDEPYLADTFLSGLSPEVRTEIEGWRRPLPDLNGYLALHDRLRRQFPTAHLQLEPVAVAACADEFLITVRKEAFARGVGIQLHLSETAYQKLYSMKQFGKTTVQRLADLGFLCSDVSCAHCVWLTKRDIGIMRETGTMVVHNPSSNLRLRSGLAPIRPMVASGVHVALGTDNLALNDDEDILQEVRLAQLLHSPPGLGEAPIPPATALLWATEAGAKVLGIEGLGSLEPGNPADLVMVQTRSIDRPVFEHGHDIAASVIQWVRQSEIDQVLVGGRTMVRGGRYIFRDREELERKAYESQQQWTLTPATRLIRSEIGKRYAREDIEGEPYYRLNSRTAETSNRSARQ
jgi:5-methylthioadenosine/S-adenosylhomocysteine deaminase